MNTMLNQIFSNLLLTDLGHDEIDAMLAEDFESGDLEHWVVNEEEIESLAALDSVLDNVDWS